MCCYLLFSRAGEAPLSSLILVGAVPAVLFLLLSPRAVLESPLWLARKGRAEEARRVLGRLRGRGYPAEEEVEEIVRCDSAMEEGEDKNYFSRMAELLADEKVWKPTSILFTMFAFQVNLVILHKYLLVFIFVLLQGLSGIDHISFYSLDIIRRAKITSIDKYQLACLIQVRRK